MKQYEKPCQKPTRKILKNPQKRAAQSVDNRSVRYSQKSLGFVSLQPAEKKGNLRGLSPKAINKNLSTSVADLRAQQFLFCILER
jgi:hypothetical protein